MTMFRHTTLCSAALILGCAIAHCGEPDAGEASRILHIIPNYQTVWDPSRPVQPLTAAEKWKLYLRSTTDPFVMANAVLGATLSHARHGTPDYGSDRSAYGERLGAAMADIAIPSVLSGAVFASLLHEDPRYFRRGTQSRFLTRVGYSVSRAVVTRSDSGRNVPNWSFMMGTAAGIGLSNLYYPGQSQSGSVMLSRIGSTLLGSALGNLLPEFWPDIQRRIFHRHH